MTIDPMTSTPRTATEAKAEMAALEAEIGRLNVVLARGRVLARRHTDDQIRRLGSRYRMLLAARAGIAERFGFGTWMR